MQCIQNAITKQILKNHLKGRFSPTDLAKLRTELTKKCIEKDAFAVIRSSDS